MMHVEIPDIALPPEAQIKIELSVTAQVQVTHITAQRAVSRFLLDQVGNLLYGEPPSLVVGDRLLWRVPVWLGSPTRGALGQLGVVDVDAQSGEILFTQKLIDELVERGNALAEHSPRSTN
jgi:hypothetical protein